MESGWLCPPLPFTENVGTPFFPLVVSNAAFRFGAQHDSKLRAVDDVRRNMANLCTAILTPITPPTWCHLSQMAKDVFHTGRDWGLLKGDRKPAYWKIPMDPHRAKITVIALRHTIAGRWAAFAPKVLLFGWFLPYRATAFSHIP